jgi:aspartyl-tRNA(Asn)/glutamyl-tRNA(Gln) amidotransferase subunit B
MKYELILGLEIHLQLITSTKMFCYCKTPRFHASPNSFVCPVCLGLPGALPVPNKEAIQKAYKFAEAVGSIPQIKLVFERKNYFYPDLPKGYQITSPAYPVGKRGTFVFLFPRNQKRINWREIHLEEDTGKSIHQNDSTLLDFNKSGMPLLELVTEPDFVRVEDAVQFAKEIQFSARFLKVSNADMEKGQLRLEANISVRKEGDKKLPGYRVELKNINSFLFMQKAIIAEYERQVYELKKGNTIKQETRGYNESTRKTFPLRSKEDMQDYRYFPEPDIPSFSFTEKTLSTFFAIDSEKPLAILHYFYKQGVSSQNIEVLFGNVDECMYAYNAVTYSNKYNVTAQTIVSSIVNKRIPTINYTPEKYVQELQAHQTNLITDTDVYESLALRAKEKYPQAFSDFQSGKEAAIGVLIGFCMKESKGKIDPNSMKKYLKKLVG